MKGNSKVLYDEQLQDTATSLSHWRKMEKVGIMKIKTLGGELLRAELRLSSRSYQWGLLSISSKRHLRG